MRYTEARMGRIAEEMLADIQQNTVDFSDNFDGTLQEPVVLPARLPNLLLNGSSGIAVGMATNIPPHNLREVVAALNYVIEHYDQQDEITVEALMEFIPGPDFPTGGVIVGSEGIQQAYGTGKGRIVLRGKAHIEEMGSNRHRIVITEIPYQINKSGLLERIAHLARSGKINVISDLRDESDRRGMSIIVELKRGAYPQKVLNQLYKYTPLQSTIGVQMLALVNGEPRLLPLKRTLLIYIQHRVEVITRRTRFQLDKALARAHILDGLLIALANLDAVIETIRQSQDADVAKERLMQRFNLSDKQAQAILDMQLRRLAALERQKIEEEQRQLIAKIEHLRGLLADPHKILEIIRTDLQEVADKYGDERRTFIAIDINEDFSEEDLVPNERVLISITQRGYIKRQLTKTFRAQGRGGRGVQGHATRDEDEVVMMFSARTHDTVLFFTNKGKVYSEKAYQIPDAGRTARGIAIVNILNLAPEEAVTAAIAVPNFNAANYCIMATRKGKVKRVTLSQFASVRPSGLIAMGLNDDDELGWAHLTSGEDDVLLITEKGRALRFSETKIRPMGRAAGGVIGIRLAPNDAVASMEIVEPNGDLLIVTQRGFGKRTPLSEYPQKGRATKGVLTIDPKALPIVGDIVGARVVQQKDDLTLISTNGIVLRTKVAQIQRYRRATRGVTIMNIKEDDSVASVARIQEIKEEE